MSSAFDYAFADGLMSEEHYGEYSGVQSQCKYDKKATTFKIDGYKEHFMVGNEKLKWLVSQQPVVVGIHFNLKMALYSSGVLAEDFLKCNEGNEVNHAVLIVGYGSAEGAEHTWCDQYWLIKNSFGMGWGEEGFFRICMSKGGSCLVNKYVFYPQKDIQEHIQTSDN